MSHNPFKRLFGTVIPVLLMTMLILPNIVYGYTAHRTSEVVLTKKILLTQSSLLNRLTISFTIFGNNVTVVDMTAAQSEQIEQTLEGAECTADPNIADKLVGCANSILSNAQMNTVGLLSELIRLTKVGGNLVLCLGTADVVQAACTSLTQEVAREIIFGPPPISNGQSQPTVPTTQPTTPPANPGPQPTLTTDCGNMVTPWVALYQYPNFGGRQLCFEGTGLINLADFGFDKQTQSINIAANGYFFDQPNGQGDQLGFYYRDEQADLGNWDNQISSFIVTS